MKIQQFVMAYRAGHDRIRSLLDDEFESLRPVLRINVEIIGEEKSGKGYVRIEFNTPVAARGKRGWLNLKTWESPATDIRYEFSDRHKGERTAGHDTAVKGITTKFIMDFLTIEYTGVGIAGGCPAENDNDGCFYAADGDYAFAESETITEPKEYCDCEFEWTDPFMDAMNIECEEILGAYKVEFER